jgi:hypothetical protein
MRVSQALDEDHLTPCFSYSGGKTRSGWTGSSN